MTDYFADGAGNPEKHYFHDTDFRALVDLLESMIHKAQYTPMELRQAALLAAIHYEYHNIRPIIMRKDEWPMSTGQVNPTTKESH